MEKRTLLLFDGHNIFIRSFSGLMRQGLSAPDGSGTWGIYGAFNVVANLVRKYEPTHVLIAFDKGRSSKRLALDPEYKAHRDKKRDPSKPMDQAFSLEFRPQLEIFKLLLNRSGVPYLSIDNVEADDIIAHAALSNNAVFDRVVIVSADHDLQQLIRQNIFVVKPSISYKDIVEEVYDAASIIEEWGVEPWRLPEIWALMGDKGDNVKGVPGIGPKKATKLIADHGNLENALNDPKVVEFQDVVMLASALIKLDTDDELLFPPLGNLQFNPIKPGDPSAKKLEDLFDELGFTQVKDRWKHNTLWNEILPFGRKLQ